MRNIIFFIFASLLFWNCTPEGQDKVAQLEAEKDSLKQVLEEKDSALKEFMDALNNVQMNLEIIREKESVIKINTKNKEGENQDINETVTNDMQLIFDLMEDNKATIADLERRLENNKEKFEKFEKVILRLNKQIKEKDVQIDLLKNQLDQQDIAINDLSDDIAKLNSDLDSLYKNQKKKNEEISKQAKELNTAFYAYGTAKELKEQGIVNRRFFGIAKVVEKYKTDYFTKIDLTKTKTIPLFCKRVKFLSRHPDGTYNFAKTGKVFDSLMITDHKKFWQSSKYLILLVSQ